MEVLLHVSMIYRYTKFVSNGSQVSAIRLELKRILSPSPYFYFQLYENTTVTKSHDIPGYISFYNSRTL